MSYLHAQSPRLRYKLLIDNINILCTAPHRRDRFSAIETEDFNEVYVIISVIRIQLHRSPPLHSLRQSDEALEMRLRSFVFSDFSSLPSHTPRLRRSPILIPCFRCMYHLRCLDILEHSLEYYLESFRCIDIGLERRDNVVAVNKVQYKSYSLVCNITINYIPVFRTVRQPQIYWRVTRKLASV